MPGSANLPIGSLAGDGTHRIDTLPAPCRTNAVLRIRELASRLRGGQQVFPLTLAIARHFTSGVSSVLVGFAGFAGRAGWHAPNIDDLAPGSEPIIPIQLAPMNAGGG